MDVFTHLLVPYAAALAAVGLWRRDVPGSEGKAAWAAVVGVSGFAPDVDGAIDPLSEWFDPLWWLQHRGVSHTLVGAPVFALAVVGALALAARRWPRRFGLFAWRRSFWSAIVLGAWSHLLLDAVTLAGVPLLWPFATLRVSLQLFGWLVAWLFPIGGLVLAAHAWGRVSRRGVVVAGALVVAALVALAGVRLALRPEVAEGELLFPRASEREWVLVREHANGTWEAALAPGARDPMWFEPLTSDTARDVIAAARATNTYKGFRLGAYGPEVARAVREEGGWNVTFTDVAQRYEALHDPTWTPVKPHHEWGYVAFLVRDDGAVEARHRGW